MYMQPIHDGIPFGWIHICKWCKEKKKRRKIYIGSNEYHTEFFLNPSMYLIIFADDFSTILMNNIDDFDDFFLLMYDDFMFLLIW